MYKDIQDSANLKDAFHPVSVNFYKDVLSLKEASCLIAYNVKRSRDNKWQNVSLPFPDALAIINQIEVSSMSMTQIFEGTKQTAILADKNRAIAEELYSHPLEKTFEKFIRGDIQKHELQAEINKTFSVKRKAA